MTVTTVRWPIEVDAALDVLVGAASRDAQASRARLLASLVIAAHANPGGVDGLLQAYRKSDLSNIPVENRPPRKLGRPLSRGDSS